MLTINSAKLKYKNYLQQHQKYVKLITESHKKFLREIKEELNRWRKKLCSCIGRIGSIKCQFFPD